MAELARYHGFNFPVYDRDTPLYTGRGIEDLCESAAETGCQLPASVVRRARLVTRSLNRLSLRETLNKADEQFELFAQDCGAKVIRHEWGLYYEPMRDPFYAHDLLPSQHSLVADVDIIAAYNELDDDEYLQIEEKAKQYVLHGTSPIAWTDPKPEQFKKGVRVGDNSQAMWLVDIDPYLGTRPVIELNHFYDISS